VTGAIAESVSPGENFDEQQRQHEHKRVTNDFAVVPVRGLPELTSQFFRH
jgi:hypothetical protein